jgi:hypothetical protein
LCFFGGSIFFSFLEVMVHFLYSDHLKIWIIFMINICSYLCTYLFLLIQSFFNYFNYSISLISSSGAVTAFSSIPFFLLSMFPSHCVWLVIFFLTFQRHLKFVFSNTDLILWNVNSYLCCLKDQF